MKRYLQLMSSEERSTFRRWQAAWICIYVAIAVLLTGVPNLLPARDVENAAKQLDRAKKQSFLVKNIDAMDFKLKP